MCAEYCKKAVTNCVIYKQLKSNSNTVQEDLCSLTSDSKAIISDT